MSTCVVLCISAYLMHAHIIIHAVLPTSATDAHSIACIPPLPPNMQVANSKTGSLILILNLNYSYRLVFIF